MPATNGNAHEQPNIDITARWQQMEADALALGQELRRAREAQGWTENDVAATIECSGQHVKNAEAGKIRSRTDKLLAMADLLGVQIPATVPSVEEMRVLRSRKATAARYGHTAITTSSATEKVVVAPVKPASAEDTWETLPPKRSGLWKTGPDPDDWEGMAEEQAGFLEAEARKRGFEARRYMPHPSTGVWRVGILDPTRKRDRLDARNFTEFQVWSKDPVEIRPAIVEVNTTLASYEEPEDPEAPTDALPEPVAVAPVKEADASVVWEEFRPTSRPHTSTEPRASLSPGSVYLNRKALDLRAAAQGVAWNAAMKATWFKGTVQGKTIIGLRLDPDGVYKVDYLPSRDGQSGASINVKKFAQSLGLAIQQKTLHVVHYDAVRDLLWFDPAETVNR